MLPAPVASRLKQSDQVIANGFPATTVLFADIVGFTGMSTKVTAAIPSQPTAATICTYSTARRIGAESLRGARRSGRTVAGATRPAKRGCWVCSGAIS